MSRKTILTAGPSITAKETGYVNDAVANGWNENWNGYLVLPGLLEEHTVRLDVAKILAAPTVLAYVESRSITFMTDGTQPLR